MWAEKPLLVDSLQRSHLPQLRGPVCGQQEEGHPGVMSFHDCGGEINRCGTGGGNDGDGTAQRFGKAQGEVGGGALIQMRPNP